MILASPERIAQYTERGWWGRQTLDDLFRAAAAAHPEREAVADPPNRAAHTDGQPRRLHWGELAREVARMAALLRAQGLQRDDVVVVQLVNGVEQYVVYLAALRLGLIVSPVPVQYREHELGHVLRLTQAAAVVTSARVQRHASAAMWCELARAAPGLRVLAFGAEVPPGALALDEALAALNGPGIGEPIDGLGANDIATLCWTSGTEAAPKGVPRSHNEWLIVARSVIEAAELQPGARLLNPFPLVNMAGWSTCVAGWLCLGASVVQHHPFDIGVFLRQLREERIDYTVAPPAILNQLLKDEHLLEGIDLKRLSRIGSGSAPLSEWMVRGFAERGVQIVNYFGSNEGVSLSGSPLDIPDPALRARYFARGGVGRRFSRLSNATKVRTRLVDLESGQDIDEPGHVGEFRISGPTVFAGYWKSPELDAVAFDDQGFFRSGDLFEIAGDQGQYLHFVGRCKDIVVRGGMKISAEEIESLLLGHPEVADAAVVAVPDEAMGEKVCACLVPRPGAAPTLQSLVAYLRDERRLAVYKLPEHLMLLPALPRNPVGKILKRELRSQAAAALLFPKVSPPAHG
ncbi:MAG: acyl--CoA ligase [Burkholderiales bacterium]|nr:acyl--CoA ligase [Burkholderiales bacterium]